MRAIKPKFECLLVALVVLTLATGVALADTVGRVVVKLEAFPPVGYDITQENGFAAISMEGFGMTSSPGDPMLPHKVQDILLPPDVIDSTVKLRIVSAQKRTLDGTYNIKPAGFPIRGDNKSIVDGRNVDVYQSDADYPESSVRLLYCSQMRKWKFARVDFIPFQYNPVSGKLTLTESVEIEISYSTSPTAQAASLMRDTVLEDVAAKRFINYTKVSGSYGQQAISAGEPSPANYDYVIITTNAINTGSTKLSSFVTHKQSLGYSVLVVIYGTSIQPLTGQAPNHKAEKIRQWLINNYTSMGIKYVLLIGDPSPYESGEGDIPMKMCHPERNAVYEDMAQTPTDYFYADLTGNWDIDADLFYGEWDPGDGSGDYPVTGGVDFTPEVYVGRIPVYSTDYTDLDNILEKMIDYGNESSISWRANILLPMGFQHATGPYDGAKLAEQMKDDYLDPASYSSWRMYQQGNGPCGNTSSYTSEEDLRGGSATPNVKNRWSGAGTPAIPNDFGIVCWWAHGSATSASVGYSGCWDGTLMQSSYCSSLDDDHPAFTYQCSCTNGHPETSNNLQYAILKQGGIGTVSATRISWFSTSVGYGQFDGSVTNSGIGYEYVARLVQNLGAGDALYQAKSSMSPNAHQCWLMNWYDFNLYGDPEQSIGQVGPVLKWQQPPDDTEQGIDIRCDRSDGINRILADDFPCTTTGPITKVTIWGSWFNDIKGTISKIHLSIHSDNPSGPFGWSEPDELLWEGDFSPADFNETLYKTLYEGEWFWDPTAYLPPPTSMADKNIWQYDISIDSSKAFIQQGDPCEPVVYWLDAYVELEPDTNNPNFGWKSTYEREQWNDDAVWWDDALMVWNELRYPPGHYYSDASINLAFSIMTGEETEPEDIKWSQPPVPHPDYEDTYIGWDEESHDWLPRMVLDDFQCDSNRPVTAIRWWGSFLGWNDNVIPDELPNSFLITIWDNVPAGVDAAYSHPNEIIWGTICDVYDVNFYGWEYDPRYGQIDLAKFEFYQELDPCDYWYQPNDVNVYWLGIAARYGDMPHDPCYPWGWETREHFFEDDAVRFFGWPEPNKTYPPSMFEPIEWNYETWDLSFELLSSPKIPPKPLLIKHSKWSQPPIEIDPTAEVPTYCGWDEESHNKLEPGTPFMKIVADDFRCIGSMPVTSIHWWGSFFDWEWSWAHGTLPPVVPEKCWIGFWSNVPAGAPPYYLSYSYPEILLHSVTIPVERLEISEVGSDEYYGQYPYDICYQYNVDLEPEEVFWQDEFSEMTYDDIYWISIVAEYNDVVEPYYKWGWKTRPWHWMDDAVTFTLDFEPAAGFALDPTIVNPIVDPVWGESFDMAFELDTDPNYVKWEQDYTGIRNWPHYEDEMSMGTVERWTEVETKWLQAPDLSPAGIDVDATMELTVAPIFPPQILADDFNCIKTGPITNIAIWGSWFYDEMPFGGDPTAVEFTLSIYSDNPSGPTGGWSEPNELLWRIDFPPGAFMVEGPYMGPEGYYSPCAPFYEPQNHFMAWKYIFSIDAAGAFIQEGDPCEPVIYWLAVQARPIPEGPSRFGWKTSIGHWNDDAVWAIGEFGDSFQPWMELRHPETNESLDLAFEITTEKEYEEFVPERLVADDWRCERRTPVTAIAWWGSYIGYGYEACSEGPFMPLPVKPDYFRLNIWTDVPAGGSTAASGGEAGAMTDAQIAQIRQNASSASVNVPVGLQKTNMGEERQIIFTGHVLSTDNSTSGSCGSILYAPTQDDDATFRAAVSTACGGATVDYYDARVGTPDLALLSTYDCVFTWVDLPYADKDLFGDNLADYVDAGGKVILGQWCYQSDQTNWLEGRIMTSAYCPVTVSSSYNNGIYNGDGTDCVHNGVNAYDTTYLDDATLQPGCYSDGTFTNGELSVSWRPDRKVYYSAGNTGTYHGNGDWAQLTCNMCCCISFSHPKDIIWEYEACDYDEVLVGYDKHPEGEPNEPVFRYSVRLPEDDWFRQPDFNEVFWLSIQAVYDSSTPNYDWGWTNHNHMFNDNAVEGGYVWDPEEWWHWEPLYSEQAEDSVDMSFILFTDPDECVNCADYNIDYIINFKDYADFADDWLWTGMAGGYNNSDLNCDGSVDWYDLKIFTDQWLDSCP